MKGFISFVVGVYFGIIAGQRYHVPRTPTPSEAWNKYKSRRRERYDERYGCGYDCEDNDDNDHERERSRPRNRPRTPVWTKEQMPAEIREAIEKIKAFERRLRKNEFRDFEVPASEPTGTGQSRSSIPRDESSKSVNVEASNGPHE
ncbi:hypothetical protein ElyMa_002440400 [Elysia marginata]|uniref:Uncharacterized protein n=1 Tax=Elysia marginata TaxID=1093978 RepID=A0AAV4GJE0_9GAST|nr:hypothetical protein ElyMa_002440400 [Elysia marginata]